VTCANADGDALCNAADNCPFFASANAADTDLDGRGNACECTDQNGDGRNTVSDLVAINLAIFNPALVTPLCDGNGDTLCNVLDIVAANIEIFSPTSTSTCARQPVPGP
jgi:syndecan 4